MEVQPVEMAPYPSENNPVEEVCFYAAVYLEHQPVVNALIKHNLWPLC